MRVIIPIARQVPSAATRGWELQDRDSSVEVSHNLNSIAHPVRDPVSDFAAARRPYVDQVFESWGDLLRIHFLPESGNPVGNEGFVGPNHFPQALLAPFGNGFLGVMLHPGVRQFLVSQSRKGADFP